MQGCPIIGRLEARMNNGVAVQSAYFKTLADEGDGLLGLGLCLDGEQRKILRDAAGAHLMQKVLRKFIVWLEI